LSRIADLYAKRTSGRGNAEILVAEATDEIKRLLDRLLLRESERVGLYLRLDRSTYLRRCPKEAICRDKTVERLMRTLEVVVLDEEFDPPESVGEISEDRLAKEIVPERFPEALDLAERLRMLRAALDVLDAVTPK
jgi:hypothetical protein